MESRVFLRPDAEYSSPPFGLTWNRVLANLADKQGISLSSQTALLYILLLTREEPEGEATQQEDPADCSAAHSSSPLCKQIRGLFS